jgi:tRNA isopentenyl-2-thiomethyl-A-37 hydroxylase MiaE
MGKNFLIKTSMGKPPNEMGNCPFASPWLRHCIKMNPIMFIDFYCCDRKIASRLILLLYLD